MESDPKSELVSLSGLTIQGPDGSERRIGDSGRVAAITAQHQVHIPAEVGANEKLEPGEPADTQFQAHSVLHLLRAADEQFAGNATVGDKVAWYLWSRGHAKRTGVYSHETALSLFDLGDFNPSDLHMIGVR
jgi:hypothetical protein